MEASHPQLLIWGTIIFAILLVGGITYVQTRGNGRIALVFMGLAVALTILISGIKFLNSFLPSHFIGSYNITGVPYMVASPGWRLLIHAWPFWFFPLFLLGGPLLVSTLYLSYVRQKSVKRYQEQHLKYEQRLLKQKEDAERFRQRWHEADEQIKQFLADKNSSEDKQAQLLIEIRRLQQDRTQINQRYQTDMTALKQELETKDQTNQVLQQEQANLQEEIERLRRELYKLLAKG